MHAASNDKNQGACSQSTESRRPQQVAPGADGQHDEYDFQTFKQHRFERSNSCDPIQPATALKGDSLKLRGFRSEGQFVPLSADMETVIFPGFDGGAEWGGSAFDPETGLLYVNANEMVWTASLAENKTENSGRHLYATQCGTCHRDDLTGTPPQIPSLIDLRGKRTPEQVSAVIRQGAGRMPSFPNLSADNVEAIVQYVLSGESKATSSTPSAIDL